jgi:predicted phage terminase large subunit-like protein
MASGTVLSIDTAYGIKRDNSFSVIQEWQSDGSGRHYLLDQWSGRVSHPDLRNWAIRFIKQRPVSVILVEDKGVGNALLTDLRRRVPSEVEVKGIVPTGSKIERLKRVIELIRGGSVFLPSDAIWLPDFLEEVEAFPDGFHDDQVDAMTQYLECATEFSAPAPRRGGRAVGAVATRSSFIQSAGMPVGRTPGVPYATIWAPQRRR